MANANQLLAAACASGISCLDERGLMIALAQALATSLNMTAPQLLAAACVSGVACLGDRQLLVVIAEAMREGGGGGGGGGTTQVYQDHTGSPPTDPTQPALSFPTGGGDLSQWDVASQTWK